MDASVVMLPLAGLISGFVLGFIARRNFFCTLTSLEQYWYAGNGTGVRTWAFAAVVAIVATQASVFIGWFDPATSFYLNPTFDITSAVVGGIAFGIGMALIGTCGFGALVRLGGGSLKSLVAVLVLGITALSTQRGLVSLVRPDSSHPLQIEFESAGDQSITSIISSAGGAAIGPFVVTLVVLAVLIWIFKDPQYRRDGRAILTGLIFGGVITASWLITSSFAELSFDPVQIEAASFVAPVSDTILQFGLVTGTAPDYGVGMVLGTIAGAAAAAIVADDIRWEACDDAVELKRHLFGAALMGFGGVLALGCTIGQGISAASVLAISAPTTVISILIGAKLGLAWLLEGRLAIF